MININKISINKVEFYKVKGSLNTANKRVLFEISKEQLKEIFDIDIHGILFQSDVIEKKIRNIYIIGEDERIYSCIGCIFSVHTKETICFSSVSVDLIMQNALTDTIDIKTKELTFKTYYSGHPIHSSYIKSFNFNYNSNKKIIINTYSDDDFHIDFTIKSKNECSYNKMSKIIYTVIEMLMLMFGDIPTITDIKTQYKEQEVKLYFEIVDKYKAKKTKSIGKEILGNFSQETINKESIKKFELFRDNTKIIYDLFMTTVNSNGYIEIKNCNLIQLMEGMYKTLVKSKEELRDILIYYFTNSKSSRKILTRRDKRRVKDQNNTQVFIYKAVNHRNYLSHLNLKQNKNVFYGLENIYAYWKLCVCIRVYILEYIGISYDNKLLVKYIKEIENWVMKRKLRFSSKINN